MAYTAEQEAAARALLAKGNVLGQQASQQTGVAFQPAASASSSPSPQQSSPSAPSVSYGPSTVTTSTGQTQQAPQQSWTSSDGKSYPLAGTVNGQNVYRDESGQYFTLRTAATGQQAIGTSYSGTPSGFVPVNSQQTAPQPAPQTQSGAAPLGSSQLSQQLAQQAQALGVQNVPQSLLGGQQGTQQAGAQTQAGTQAGTQPVQGQQGGLVMPANGSVVDLLNMAGQDSSFAARQQLAQQFGIPGYAGTAAQNTELASKYLAAYNASSGAAPQSGADGRTAVESLIPTSEQAPNSLQSFYSAFGSMDPITASLFQQIASIDSAMANRPTYAQIYADELAKSGVQPLQEELANTIADIRLTEDQVREELASGGGMILESQVRGVAAARSKILLTKAEQLSNIIDSKNEAIDRMVQLTGMDRFEADKQMDRKLGLTQFLANYSMQMQDRDRQNLKDIGVGALSQLLKGDPVGMRKAESLLGLPNGALSNKEFLDSQVALSGPPSVQEYQYAVKQGYTGSFSDYQNEDANRKISIARAGVGATGLSTQQYNALNGITTRFQADPIINLAVKGGTMIAIADQIIADPSSATNQLKSLYVLVKNLDPDSAVREGELALANQTQSYLQQFGNSLTRVSEGRVISPAAAAQLAQATKELASAWNATAQKRQVQYQSQSNTLGVGGEFGSYIVGSNLNYQQSSVPAGTTKQYNGHTYVSDGTQWVLQE